MMLTESQFQYLLIEVIKSFGYFESYQKIVLALSERGYVYLMLLTFTFMPQNLCLIGSQLVGLNSEVVLCILVVSKLFKMSWMYYAALRFKGMILGVHERWKEKNKKLDTLG